MVESCPLASENTYVQPLRVALQDPCEPQLLELLLQPGRQTGVHAASSTEHDSLVETGAHVDIGALDGVEEQFGDTGLVDIHQVRLEETFGGFKALAADADDATIREGVGLDKNGGVFGELLVQLEIVGHVAELLLDLAHGLEVGGTVQSITATEQEGDEVTGDITTGDIKSANVVVKDCRFVDGDNVGDTVTGVNDHTTAETCGMRKSGRSELWSKSASGHRACKTYPERIVQAQLE